MGCPLSPGAARSSPYSQAASESHGRTLTRSALHEPRPRAVKGFQQMLLAAVPNSDPDQAGRNSGSEKQVQKIRVLADENEALRLRMP